MQIQISAKAARFGVIDALKIIYDAHSNSVSIL